jgi:lysophospholipase L1-like esterase
VHGGGANDLYTGSTVAATTTAAVGYFTNLHTLFPNAKLVFVEAVNAPLAGFNNHQADAVALRQAVQAQLAAAGVPAYFLDLQTTRQPISGTGYVTAANGTGNSDIYVGSDAVHPTVKGNQYFRHLLANKVAKVLADKGPLVGTLIT